MSDTTGERDAGPLHVSTSQIDSCASWMLQLLDFNHSRSLSRHLGEPLTPRGDTPPGPA